MSKLKEHYRQLLGLDAPGKCRKFLFPWRRSMWRLLWSIEAVYLPGDDVMVTIGPAPDNYGESAFWVYRLEENAWYRMEIPFTDITGQIGQNRALVYDPHSQVMFLVLGSKGNRSNAQIFALRYQHNEVQVFRQKDR